VRETAIRQGESLRGELIFYRAGKVTGATSGGRVELTLGRNVDALMLIPVALTTDGARRPTPGGFVRVAARAARGGCARHDPDRAKSSTGGHTAHTGHMRGGAELVVTVPHPGQR
jgi:hypothetical protein